MENSDGWTIDADLAFPFMRRLGWQIQPVPWRKAACDWNDFAAVYIGTPWDYPQSPLEFIELLETIERSHAVLVNDLALVRWTMHKTYLRDLCDRGIDVVPSSWFETYSAGLLRDAFARFAVDTVVVKPVVSTNATNTFVVGRDFSEELEVQLQTTFGNLACVIQPFIENIRHDGEYSLFYFDSEISHAIRKVPKQGDFRVQEEFGAGITAVQPEQALLDAGNKVLREVRPAPVYARVDFVRSSAGRFLLMELELIEPSMYLRMDSAAPRRFAEAFDKYVTKVSGGVNS